MIGLRLVVTGTKGQVAQALRERGAAHGTTVLAFGRPELDLTNPSSLERALGRTEADVIINAAAYTAVDRAEAESDVAMRVNGDGAGVVSRLAARRGWPIVQLSSDYVFDGASARPYIETDPTEPIGAYGRSKLAGEHAVAAETADHAILRTSWVYSPFGQNFVKTMLRLGGDRKEVGVVADQRGAPTSAFDIADALIAVCAKLRAERDNAALRGIFHMTGAGEATWATFAETIFEVATRHGRSPVRVRPITTADYPTPARRPANSRLSNRKLARVYGIGLPDWSTSTEHCVTRLLRDEN